MCFDDEEEMAGHQWVQRSASMIHSLSTHSIALPVLLSVQQFFVTFFAAVVEVADAPLEGPPTLVELLGALRGPLPGHVDGEANCTAASHGPGGVKQLCLLGQLYHLLLQVLFLDLVRSAAHQGSY